MEGSHPLLCFLFCTVLSSPADFFIVQRNTATFSFLFFPDILLAAYVAILQFVVVVCYCYNTWYCSVKLYTCKRTRERDLVNNKKKVELMPVTLDNLRHGYVSKIRYVFVY